MMESLWNQLFCGLFVPSRRKSLIKLESIAQHNQFGMIPHFQTALILMATTFTRPLILICITLTALAACRGAHPELDRSVSGLANRFEDFALPTIDDQTLSLSRDPAVQFQVICFLGTECPLARVYGPRLERMSKAYAQSGVSFIGINSNLQDSLDELKAYASQHGITFPIAKDYDRLVALRSGATRTPEVFVVDRSGKIRYQGRIDDQYQPGIARSAATRHDLRDAIDQLLAGNTVSNPRTSAVGCLIALPRSTTSQSDITFCDQVIRILQKHCIECHREGEIGPFALEDYDEVVGWADMSLEVIDQGRMPPWHASSEHGSFANARHISEQDKDTLRQWTEAGMPYGDARRLPPQPEYVQGWRLPRVPDLVMKMDSQPFRVPAQGTVEYQYFVVDPGFKEDKWIRGAQVIPGNAAVVHHAIVFTRPPDGTDVRDIGFLTAYVPGQKQGQLPEGYAQLVPAGSRFVFQMHYTPNGRPAEDQTRLGLVFAEPTKVTHQVFVLGGIDQDFEIPPQAASYSVAGQIGGFPKDGFLLSITPHMHLRGKSFDFYVESGDQVTRLLEVPSYDFNWQHNYQLTSPLPLRQVDRLRFKATFDNSADNPNNPDPNEYVTWGDQTWQEMAVTFIGVAQPLKAQALTRSKQERKRNNLLRAEQREQWQREAEQFAARYIARFDSDGDQRLSAHELPASVRMFSFHHFDHDSDARLSHDEIKNEAYWRLERSR